MKKDKPILLANWIMCPDGTMIPSFHRHDYREHVTVDNKEWIHPEGKEQPEDVFSDQWKEWRRDSELVVTQSRYSMVDGGSAYIRRGGVYTEMSIYSDDPYEVIRRFLCRGGRGKDNNQPLTWVPLFRIDDDWLEAIIEYEENRCAENLYLEYYRKELNYRKENNIKWRIK